MQNSCILTFTLLILVLAINRNDATTSSIDPLADRFFAMTSTDPIVSNKVIPTKVSSDKLPPVPTGGILRLNFNDSPDSDNGHQLWDYERNHHGGLSKTNRLTLVLTGRPGFIGVPIHVKTEMDAMADYKETFLLRTKWFMSEIIKAETSEWQNGSKDWKIIDGPMYSQAVKEDSALILQSHALSRLLLIIETTGKSAKEVMESVDIYDGGIANFKDPKGYKKDDNIFTTPLSHRIHVLDYMTYDENGKVLSYEDYRTQYLKFMNKFPPMGEGVYTDDLVKGTDGKPDRKLKIYNPEKDTNLKPRRDEMRIWLIEHMKHIIKEKGLEDFHMRSLEDLMRFIEQKNDKGQDLVKQYDAFFLGPFTAAAEMFRGERGLKLLKKMRFAYMMAFTTTYSPIFTFQFNNWADIQAANIFFPALKKAQLENKNWPVVFVLPTEIAKSDAMAKRDNKGKILDDDEKKYWDTRIEDIHKQELSTGETGIDIIAKSYRQYANAKGAPGGKVEQHDHRCNYFLYMIDQSKPLNGNAPKLGDVLVQPAKMTAPKARLAKKYFEIQDNWKVELNSGYLHVGKSFDYERKELIDFNMMVHKEVIEDKDEKKAAYKKVQNGAGNDGKTTEKAGGKKAGRPNRRK